MTRASIPANLINVRFLEASDGASIHPCKHPMGRASFCQPGNVKCLEASDGAGIHRCQPGNVRFLQASDGASSHRCQPTTNVRFLEASDGASIHRCQPGNVRFIEASDGASIHRCQPGHEASDGASIVRFLEASDGASIHPCKHPMGRASIPANLINVRFLEEHPCLPASIAANMSIGSGIQLLPGRTRTRARTCTYPLFS